MGNRHWNIAKGTTDLRVEYSWQSNYPSEIQTSFKKLILSLDKTLQNTQQTWGWGLSSFLCQSRNHPQARHWQPSTLRSYSASKATKLSTLCNPDIIKLLPNNYKLSSSYYQTITKLSPSFCKKSLSCHEAVNKQFPATLTSAISSSARITSIKAQQQWASQLFTRPGGNDRTRVRKKYSKL